ncbi:MAG: InlB B-repeat-containing protein [Clostridiales bacterium]|nr:InlB B-repeat-containing protein [Clostridiales bacterium]
MAAPSGTVWGSIANSKGRIGIYASTTSAAQVTNVTVEVWVWTRYACYDSSNTFYFTNDATTATTSRGSVSFNHTVNSSWSESNQTKIGTYTFEYQRSAAAKTVYCAAKLTGIDWIDATMTVTASYDIPALTGYAVTYNANGGAGAPANQTKLYGINLTLSDMKPTRTGYAFQGWATSGTATTAEYASGAIYTGNAALTLYAVWQASTYIIYYDANGGTGAPANQTKIHGVALTLSSTVPTRANYGFLGWSTNAYANAAEYAAGGSYTANANNVLFAVWKLAYENPAISAFTVSRCTSTMTADDYGTYAKVDFTWSLDQTQGANTVNQITIRFKTTAAASWTSVPVTANGTNGRVLQLIGGALSTDTSYDVEISVQDSKGGVTTLTRTIGAAKFAIDFLSGGTGVAFGKPATRSSAVESSWDIYDKNGDVIQNGVAAQGTDDPNTTTKHLILTNVNTPMGEDYYMFIQTFFAGAKGEYTDRIQIAFPRNRNGSVYHRHYTTGQWSDWRRHLNEDEGAPANFSYSNGMLYITTN